ncbi:MAG: ATP-binding cassette domain-containing protein [Anaerolineales bacterium]|nr:ATP-binding cassette domain-containing protein [Anaerolineales bacterium]
MHHTLDIQDLHFSYPDGRKALRGVSLFINPSEKTALVGPNGSGKSTLLLHLNGILRGEGEVHVCGKELTDDNLRQIRASVGLVFQDPDDQLFSQSVYEDVAFGPLYMDLPKEEVAQKVRQALEAVGMAGSEARVPHHLSEGEKKRVAIATVLSMDPEVLVLDEPTAGLDPRGRRELIQLLRGLPQTMLAATHDMRMVAELFDRTVIIDEGKVVADGPTAQILAEPHLLELHGLEAP